MKHWVYQHLKKIVILFILYVKHLIEICFHKNRLKVSTQTATFTIVSKTVSLYPLWFRISPFPFKKNSLYIVQTML